MIYDPQVMMVSETTDSETMDNMQGSAKWRAPGSVNFVPAVPYHFCLALPAAFTQPGDHLLAEPCIIHHPHIPHYPECTTDFVEQYMVAHHVSDLGLAVRF